MSRTPVTRALWMSNADASDAGSGSAAAAAAAKLGFVSSRARCPAPGAAAFSPPKALALSADSSFANAASTFAAPLRTSEDGAASPSRLSGLPPQKLEC